MKSHQELLKLKQLVSETKKLAQPIDFATLESRGVISKAGGNWYRVRNIYELPEHARKKISAVAQDRKGTKVKFTSASRFARLAEGFEQLAAKKQ